MLIAELGGITCSERRVESDILNCNTASSK